MSHPTFICFPPSPKPKKTEFESIHPEPPSPIPEADDFFMTLSDSAEHPSCCLETPLNSVDKDDEYFDLSTLDWSNSPFGVPKDEVLTAFGSQKRHSVVGYLQADSEDDTSSRAQETEEQASSVLSLVSSSPVSSVVPSPEPDIRRLESPTGKQVKPSAISSRKLESTPARKASPVVTGIQKRRQTSTLPHKVEPKESRIMLPQQTQRGVAQTTLPRVPSTITSSPKSLIPPIKPSPTPNVTLSPHPVKTIVPVSPSNRAPSPRGPAPTKSSPTLSCRGTLRNVRPSGLPLLSKKAKGPRGDPTKPSSSSPKDKISTATSARGPAGLTPSNCPHQVDPLTDGKCRQSDYFLDPTISSVPHDITLASAKVDNPPKETTNISYSYIPMPHYVDSNDETKKGVVHLIAQSREVFSSYQPLSTQERKERQAAKDVILGRLLGRSIKLWKKNYNHGKGITLSEGNITLHFLPEDIV
ncbi:hypothetical protein CPB86DRAFT_799967 [Serendipita vermifera]|nr:hypothetical protein CPB86DRAFT_799967 [Serendipita vermifera]